ncbi:50S ribosomal protein L11 methyltransferase [Desulfofustis limnaeus]|jgi:ribosomal protein L11 methyltransferase|uniref:Methyltransferase domain-containing protein n=1 Tax=Desulfofustis limnaeus TaxID=2740163 RepID=A0ABN6M831_9BACT|nr:50S ribosomal protein L11 methyltransferase [Desulfofustis limnaeus]MDX9896743.1 50S ribosomal protein L11 methyltransferase [Desulfofustis sp.]BDD89021.1 hypothetical protein DPPLL_33860 [Desulfofustis limnaeus]
MPVDPLTLRPLLPDDELTVLCVRGRVPERREYPPGFLGNWQEGDYSYLFFLEPQSASITQLLAEEAHLQVVERFRLSYRQWQEGRAEPCRVGRIMVQPLAAEGFDVPSDCLMIKLDAGLVFGDGCHPTTRDCLEAVQRACSAADIRRVLDLGTGSGLLALAAARLGCRQVVAVDLNLLAARTAQRNVRLNSLAATVAVVNGRAEDVCRVEVDLLIANIGYQVLADIIRSGALSPPKWFVFSGLQTSEAGAVADLLAQRGAVVVKRWQSEKIWHTFLGFIPA